MPRANRHFLSEDGLASGSLVRNARWTRSLAVGSEGFVQRIQQEMGADARFRTTEHDGAGSYLKEPAAAYWADFGVEMGPPRPPDERK
jgi:hypothetical protein